MHFQGSISFFAQLSLVISGAMGRADAESSKRISRKDRSDSRNVNKIWGRQSTKTRDQVAEDGRLFAKQIREELKTKVPNKPKGPEFMGLYEKTAQKVDLQNAPSNKAKKAPSLAKVECDPTVAQTTDTGILSAASGCPADFTCIPLLTADANSGLCVQTPASISASKDDNVQRRAAAHHDRNLQNGVDAALVTLNAYCGYPKFPHVECTGCPLDVNAFNFATDSASLYCESAYFPNPLTVNFSPPDIVERVINVDPPSEAYQIFDRLCGPFPTIGDNPFLPGSCDCPAPGFDPDTQSATVNCAAACHDFSATFYGDGTAQVNEEAPFCDYTAINTCNFFAETCNCDTGVLDDLSGSGSFSCILDVNDCPANTTFYIVDGFFNRSVRSVDYACLSNALRNYDFFCYDQEDCDCSGIDRETYTGSGSCQRSCDSREFTLVNNTAVAYSITREFYTAYGNFVYKITQDGYTCPTVNGESCTCEPIDDCPYFTVLRNKFSFVCSSGLTGNTCDYLFLAGKIMCGPGVAEGCYEDDGCDCSMMTRNATGGLVQPLDGSMVCTYPTCGQTTTVNFFGDQTFQGTICQSNAGMGIDELCYSIPVKEDGSCPISADGVTCFDCVPTRCEYESFSFSFNCPAGDGSMVPARLCDAIPDCEEGGNEDTLEPSTLGAVFTDLPSQVPSSLPTHTVSNAPTASTTATPTNIMTTMANSTSPTDMPTVMANSTSPTDMPTVMANSTSPTDMPTVMANSTSPSDMPTSMPIVADSAMPTESPADNQSRGLGTSSPTSAATSMAFGLGAASVVAGGVIVNFF